MSRPAVRDDLRALEGYHSPQVSVDVRLNTNEAPEPPPDGFAEAVAEAARRVEWHRYPDRAAGELRAGLADLHGVDPTQVFCANGSNEVLQTLLLTYAGPGRRVLTFEPTYALHAHLTRITGGTHVAVDRDERFAVTPERVEAAIEEHRPSVTFLCSPNNPTGLVEPPEVVASALAATARTGGVLVVDEAYGQFAGHTALDLLGSETPLAVSRTFSKTWAMAAARLGYLVAPAWMVAELDKVVLPYHLDALKQAAGLAALGFTDEMERRVSLIVEERGRVSAALAELGAEVFPSGANFVLFRPAGGDGAAVWQGLVDRSVLVRNTASWDRLDGCLRVTLGTPDENDRFLAALADIGPGGGTTGGS